MPLVKQLLNTAKIQQIMMLEPVFNKFLYLPISLIYKLYGGSYMRYSTDLSERHWSMIELFFIGENRGKHFQIHSKRELVNAVLYLNKTGCQWRLLPKDFPPYSTVWSFYRRALKSGLWEKIMFHLVKASRLVAGRYASPSYSLIDAQSVKTTSASEDRGIDGGKKS